MTSWTTFAALLLCAGTSVSNSGAPSHVSDPPDQIDQSAQPHQPHQPGPRCSELVKLYNVSSIKKRFISVAGQEHSVPVYWSEGPARAAAALLLVILQHALHYSGVWLEKGPRDLCDLVVSIRSYNQTERLALVPTTTWNHHRQCNQWTSCDSLTDGFCGLGGPQVVVMEKAVAALSVRAHVYLSVRVRTSPACTQTIYWTFYGNFSALRHCSFDFIEGSGFVTMYVAVETPQHMPEVVGLIENIIGAAVAVHFEPLPRALLAHRLRNASSDSFLFLDWEMWQQVPGVMPMVAAPCACASPSCAPETQVVPVRAIAERLFKYTPPLSLLTQQFKPEPVELREILDIEERRTQGDIEEAACHWAVHHPARLSNWLSGTSRFDYAVTVLICEEEQGVRTGAYTNLSKLVNDELWQVTKESNFGIGIYLTPVNCSAPAKVIHELDQLTHSTQSYRVIGVVTGVEGVTVLADSIKARKLQLVAYDLNSDAVPSTVGRVADLAAVLRRLFAECGWTRIAVLSEPSAPAEALVEELQNDDHLCLRKKLMIAADVNTTLAELVALDAGVVFLNMRAATAAAVLAAAARRGLTSARRYVWVTREWDASPLPVDMHVYIVSGACRRSHNESRVKLATQLDNTFSTWPSRASAVIDALLTLAYGFAKLQRDYPHYRDDLHANDSLSLFWKGLATENVSGVCQNLRYEDGALAEPLVFVDEWVGGKYELVAMWRVTHGKPTRVAGPQRVCNHPPHDRRTSCFITYGDCFVPSCYDTLVTAGGVVFLLALILVPMATVRVRRELRLRRQQRDIERENKIHQRLLLRREQTVLSLAEYLVPRDQLELREELGAGRSGRVHLALLRAPGRRVRAVAAKSLRENAVPSEESEFLREACTLAALDHLHIVRLVGVCTGDPLLVLMEHAFFGDLLGYLRARRHLVEGAEVETSVEEDNVVGAEEAAHVSAEALTRLVREAAAALAYLAHRGLVHRDVRAANCLVDARRSLKLGDFGMARETRDPGAHGEAEYACRRRGLFPVLWMAPESLDRGAFSAASDVWSLGVLVLEVVTLGARPYGSWSPLRVLEYVASGGRPCLPLDATAQTRGVAHSCWRRASRERPSASELVAYLAEHPRALRPALAAEWDVADVDSGYGDHYATDAADHDSAHSPDTFDRPSPDSGTAFFPN